MHALQVRQATTFVGLMHAL
ncbi:unnamed protein product [Prunus armeniaca]|uniref:Uncharacterized protein n=1 Tax=Prunus armeniaca TaxID=36596 RepID=A0A6J5UNE7_PRUAR|nr:unnamed protein product [Prunus armeniaca]